MYHGKPWRITIGLGLVAFSFLWAKAGPLLGVMLQFAPIPILWRERLPISPWQLYLSSWIIGLLGVLIAGKEGISWMKNKYQEWRKKMATVNKKKTN